ncbi:hypothetical protein [Flavobacterium cerinum]|uniref:Uncharacterized protein n=1 Tax=Flavobacterium cerinum TaxID=2502784 RepID=A0A3S3Q7P5_9FLAO|nr:hypothetical protein [Flavobacterium cerinum]RWW91968.1 hypothetical protein EPI11_17225 [Flavobacterium cerinum]
MENREHPLPVRLQQILEFPKWIFGISFTIGTILFAVFMINGSKVIIIGFLYVLIAIFINTIAAGVLAVCAYVYKDYQNEIVNKTVILFINIPVAILYCYLVFSRI